MKKTIFSILVILFSLSALSGQVRPTRPGQGPAPSPRPESESSPRPERPDSKPFRGQRKLSEDENIPVSILSIDAEAWGEGYQIDIHFSGPVNPQSLNGRTITINSRPLPQNVKISFNREGTRARFFVEVSELRQIILSGIKNFDGNPIPPKTQHF